MMSLITGLFKDQDSAEHAYKSLTVSGYTSNEIDVVMSEGTREKYYGKNTIVETEVSNTSAKVVVIGWAIPEDRLGEYEQGINEGGILIGMKSKSIDDAHRFEKEWNTDKYIPQT
jgi:hypothetical protein